MLKFLYSDKIIEEASAYFKSLPESKQKELKEALSNGRALLRNAAEMKAYLHHYGEMHRQKLLRAFAHIPDDIFSHNISVVDWGCGQGLGSIVLNEYIEKKKCIGEMITDITLIEPARMCLNRAESYIGWTLPKSMVTAIRKKAEDVLPEDLCIQEGIVIHIMSNIVDMPEFSGDGVVRILDSTRKYRHIIIMVSPFYPEEGRGKRMDDFADTLKGFRKIYSFQKHKDEWNEDYSCQIRILDNAV